MQKQDQQSGKLTEGTVARLLENASLWNQSDVGKWQSRMRQRGTMNKTETIDEFIQLFRGISTDTYMIDRMN